MRNAIMMVLTIALGSACIEQKQDDPKAASPAPQAAPTPPPEPTRSALVLSPTASYSVVAAASGKCLQFVTGADGARAEIRACNGAKPQLFTMRPVAGGYYELVNVQSNSCVDVPAFSQGDGAAVQQWACNSGPNQQWIVADAGEEAIRLVARHSGKVLTVEDDKATDGSLVSQAGWKSAASQRFKLQALGAKTADAKGKGGAGSDSGSGGSIGKSGKAHKSTKVVSTTAKP